MAQIREVIVKQDENGGYKSVEIVFGPHYFIDLLEEEGHLILQLGATHHGIRADASEVGGELEQFIYEIRENHPDNVVG